MSEGLPHPKKQLEKMLTRIFADGVAEEHELTHLILFITSGVLTPVEVQETITEFVQNTWKITIADGHVSDEEKKRLRAIVDALGLEHADFLPDGIRKALA